MGRISPPHVQRVLRPLRPHHPEMGEELLLRVEVRRPQFPVRHVCYLDHWHCRPPLSMSCPIASHGHEVNERGTLGASTTTLPATFPAPLRPRHLQRFYHIPTCGACPALAPRQSFGDLTRCQASRPRARI